MNSLQTVNTTDRTPIEILLQVGEDERVSSRSVYKFLGLNPDNYSHWFKRSILDNQFAESGTDYLVPVIRDGNPQGGRPTNDYRLSIPFAKKLCMLSRTERGEQAREYFIKVEDKLRHIAQRLPQLTANELVLKIAQANVELEKRLSAHDERFEAIEQTVIESAARVETSLKAFNQPGMDWKDSMEVAIRGMVGGSKFALIKLKGDLYAELEVAASCDLNSRMIRRKKRMKKFGATTRECNALTKLDIISRDKKLRTIFESIVKRQQALSAQT